jgi:hypothetical protein
MLSFGAIEGVRQHGAHGRFEVGSARAASRQFTERSMARQLNITYYADRDMLGLVSDEDYEQFKDLLLEALHKEWPKATVAVDDGEHVSIEVQFANGDFPSAKAEQDAKSDVESRVHEIANDVIEERQWATEEEYEGYDEDYDEELEERRGRDEDEDY